MEQPHINTKVEGVLCVGGPIKYKLLPDSGVTTDWLKTNMIHGIVSFNNNEALALVLALPLIWASLDETEQHQAPPFLAQQFQQAYQKL